VGILLKEGKEKIIIELPVNIGAPAARNWLIARDETWQSDYIAFLDDDITMPENW